MELIKKSFWDLTREEIYDIFQLRAEIFILEHQCLYNDFDYKDQDSIHFYIREKGKIIAYLRAILREEAYLGRVCVLKEYRGNFYSQTLINSAIEHIFTNSQKDRIYIEALATMEAMYKKIGFKPISEEYLLDNMPHIKMLYDKTSFLKS